MFGFIAPLQAPAAQPPSQNLAGRPTPYVLRHITAAARWRQLARWRPAVLMIYL
jgi:hypothetical protein